MTRTELITSIGEVLLRLDKLRKDSMLDEWARLALIRVRNALAKQQMLLAITDFQESPTALPAIAKRFQIISTELQRVLDPAEIRNIPPENLEQLLVAVDSLISPSLQS